MYDDFDDDDSPEDVLHSSAAPARRTHPMDGWREVMPGKPSTWSPETAHKASQTSTSRVWWQRFHAWRESVGDHWIGWRERRHQARGQGPSERAWDEALEYFAGRYRERLPDPKALARLVRRNGTPDWSNPFPEGHPRHYDYHPDGLLMMDITVLLEGMMQAMDDSVADLDEIDTTLSRDQVEWVTLEDAVRDNEQDARRRSQNQQRLAMISWAMVLAWGNGLDRAWHAVHRDNLTAITIETLLVLDPKPWGLTLPKIAAGAVAAGLINLPTAQALLRQRTLVDREQAGQAPAKRSVPKAPPLPLDAWLAKRAVPSTRTEAHVTPLSATPTGTSLPTGSDFDSRHPSQ